MGVRLEKMPVGVQKNIKKIADYERKILAILRQNPPDEEEKVTKIMDQADAVVEKLFNTRFAVLEVGVYNPEDPDDLMAMGEYLLGEYAMERIFAEQYNKEYDEDLFYAGAYIRETGETYMEEAYDDTVDFGDDFEDDFDADEDDDLPPRVTPEEFQSILEDIMGKVQNAKAKKNGGRIVPLFGEDKGNKLQ